MGLTLDRCRPWLAARRFLDPPALTISSCSPVHPGGRSGFGALPVHFTSLICISSVQERPAQCSAHSSALVASRPTSILAHEAGPARRVARFASKETRTPMHPGLLIALTNPRLHSRGAGGRGGMAWSEGSLDPLLHTGGRGLLCMPIWHASFSLLFPCGLRPPTTRPSPSPPPPPSPLTKPRCEEGGCCRRRCPTHLTTIPRRRPPARITHADLGRGHTAVGQGRAGGMARRDFRRHRARPVATPRRAAG